MRCLLICNEWFVRRIAFMLCLLFIMAASTSTGAQEPVFASPEEAADDEDFQTQGEYVGQNQSLQVIALGDGQFQLVFYEGGLPGAGWTGAPPRRVDGDADLVAELVEEQGFKKVLRESPTLGANPPAGAVVLFDGSEASLANWQDGARRTDDGLLMEGVTSRQTFGDYTIHLEFRTPFQPTASGQGRGNSGLYHQGRYETQILDSFGLEGKDNETGGIYTVRRPDVNTCYPPLSWQTYDVDFTAARYDEQGKKVSDARLTVRLNGVLVQSDIAVPTATRAAPLGEAPADGPIYLQDHGNPVRFRNIWVLPRNSERDARRPIVAGYERLYAATALGATRDDGTLIDGGQLLAEGLGCLNCHGGRERVWEPAVGPVLNGLTGRIRPDFLKRWIEDPHSVKPGTHMPDVLTHLSAEERGQAASAIASYLMLADPSAALVDLAGDAAAAERGQRLYHTIGCAACHAPQEGTAPTATSVPLGPVAEKYTLDSLAEFLQNPHATRPDGRMPRLAADAAEARDLATYLLRDVVLVPGAQQFSRRVYRGGWDQLPDFNSLQPIGDAEIVNGLTFSGIEPLNNFGAVYEAYLPISTAGKYDLTVGSDDGSRVLVDDQEVARVEGTHPYQQATGSIQLEPGVHRLRVEYFEAGGEEQLTLEIAGPKFPRMSIGPLVTQDPEGNLDLELVPQQFKADPGLVAEGERYFTSLGCANCHAFEPGGKRVVATLEATPWRRLKSDAGCLAEAVAAKLPQYDLTVAQRNSLSAAIEQPSVDRERARLIQLTLAAANCYACHSRSGIGGPETARNHLFTSTTPEMGDEGRVPPPLTGVGDKLRDEYFAEVLDHGANKRPYMQTRMPAFGYDRMKLLHQRINKQDQLSTDLPSVDTQPQHQWLADGRELVGNDGLACIKCHTYGGEGTPGIQAIDMLEMPKRLRRDWFHRYMLDPQSYRPGTRMPASFPDGKSVLTSIADGSPDYQITAMWEFLKSGDRTKIPAGLRPGAIELEPIDRPIIYRNFLTDMSPRGIAVGYPEHIHLAWDAETASLAKIWRNQFLDASLHWQGRGPGQLGPLGDAVIVIERAAPVASLDSVTAAWPERTNDDAGYRFNGYRLDADGRPSFVYHIGKHEVVDKFIPVDGEKGTSWLRRELTVKPASSSLLVARLATGNIERLTPTTFRINDQYVIEINQPVKDITQVEDKPELRIELDGSQQSTLEINYRW